MSVKKKDVFKVLHSSGTSNQSPSKFFLIKNSKEQINVLSKIFKIFFRYSRLPMLVIDSNIYKKKDKNYFYLLELQQLQASQCLAKT